MTYATKIMAGTVVCLTACGAADGEEPALRGVLGYAEFVLQCAPEECTTTGALPPLLSGTAADLSFDVELRTDFPHHERGAYIEFHAARFPATAGTEVQTVLAISEHNNGYLIDYAYLFFYDADQFTFEPLDGTAVAVDDCFAAADPDSCVPGTFVLYRGADRVFEVRAFLDSRALFGAGSYTYTSSDPSVVEASDPVRDQVLLRAKTAGEAEIRVSGAGHVQTFTVRVRDGRTNPPAAGSDTDTGTGSDTDGSTTAGDTDTDTDGSTSAGDTDSTGSTGGGR